MSVKAIKSGAIEFLGVGFGTDRPVRAVASAALDSRWSYHLSSRGVGGSAIADGGVDAAAFEDGNLLDLKSIPRWHRRISGFEDASDSGTGTLLYPSAAPGRSSSKCDLAPSTPSMRAYGFSLIKQMVSAMREARAFWKEPFPGLISIAGDRRIQHYGSNGP
jgi:hypothetical protein